MKLVRWMTLKNCTGTLLGQARSLGLNVKQKKDDSFLEKDPYLRFWRFFMLATRKTDKKKGFTT